RFKVSASGKVISAQAGKRHGMIKRTNKFIRNARGTTVMSRPNQRLAKRYMPYDR
ncbi:MAG: 50S ribosomal protein L35, partial [Boseongicola sp.]|nr:50S ribosomal protein L35 [Boseongicola sp.]